MSDKQINIQEKLGELTKPLQHAIANQDSYYVYIDKEGNVYDEKGFYIETLKPDSVVAGNDSTKRTP